MKCSAMLRTGLALALIVFAAGCSDDQDDVIVDTSGGTTSIGGKTNSAGATNRGGTSSTGGKSSAGSPNTSAGTAGKSGAGAPNATGGLTATGGAAIAGNTAAGGPGTDGGTAGTGGVAIAGNTAAGGPGTNGGTAGTGGVEIAGNSAAGAPEGVAGTAGTAGSSAAGAPATGGAATGGAATGGAAPATGGAATGGAGTGGAAPATGGAATGGAGTGGAAPATGGAAPATGGAGTGGATPATGGAGTGGAGTGGAGTGGAATGGAATGGAATGGAATGGAATGGTTGTDVGGTAGTAGATDVGGTAGTAGTNGTAGAAGGTAGPIAYFIKQTNGTSVATLIGGVLTVKNTNLTTGNNFKWADPNYYGSVSNAFIALPTMMTGDFSITADITVTKQNSTNNASGIGVGITTGFAGTDSYAYILMRNGSSSATSNTAQPYYVKGVGSIGTSVTPAPTYTPTTPMRIIFSRVGSNMSYGVGPVSGGNPTLITAGTGNFTNGGTPAYGAGSVYPTISFANVDATITNYVIKDSSGTTVFDSATGSVIPHTPSSVSLSSSLVSVNIGASTSVTATAIVGGDPPGALSTVTAVATDPTVVSVSVTNNASNSTINLTGLKTGTTTVTVTNDGDPNPATNKRTFTITVYDFSLTDPYSSIAGLTYPAVGATAAYTDGELALTFENVPTLNTGGFIKIYRLTDGVEVDNINFVNESLTIGTTAIAVGSQLVRVSGNTVYFTPHLGKLAYGTGYYVAIPKTAITGTFASQAFVGFSNLNSVGTWRFTTRTAPTLTATNVTVDGAQVSTPVANFRTIQGALSAMAATTTNTSVVINVAVGTYNELLRYAPATVTAGQTVRIVGPAGNNKGDNCLVQWANGNGMNGSTATRASFYFTGANLILENISLRNTGVRATVNQAETIYFASGGAMTMAAHNCSFYSNQDTIQTSGRNWFYDCYIEGNVDFIWGTADAALFEGCSLRVLAESTLSSSYSMVVARTGATIPTGGSGTVGKGYVIWNSTVSVDAGMNVYFGRDAGAASFYDQVALINVAFSGGGSILDGLWSTGTYQPIGDGSSVGWKSSNVTGLNFATASLSPLANTSTVPAGLASEFDTRDHILNRVVTVTAGAPVGFQAATTANWDVSTLATAWGAP